MPICPRQQKLSFVKKKTGLLFFNDTDTVAVGQKTGWVAAHDYYRYRPTSKENVGQLPVAGPGGPLAQAVSVGRIWPRSTWRRSSRDIDNAGAGVGPGAAAATRIPSQRQTTHGRLAVVGSSHAQLARRPRGARGGRWQVGPRRCLGPRMAMWGRVVKYSS